MSEFVETLLQGISRGKLYFDSFSAEVRGKRRHLHRPSRAMKELHHRLMHILRNLNRPMAYATGAILGKMRQDHILPHLQSRYFYITDLQDAYGNVDLARMAVVLCEALSIPIEDRSDLQNFLECYFFDGVNGGVCTGGPASSDLFNLYCDHWLDTAIGELCKKHGLVYTRYLDDLVISGKDHISKSVRSQIVRIIEQAKFSQHPYKTHYCDLAKGEAITLVGVGLRWEDDKARPYIPSAKIRELEGLMHGVDGQSHLTHGRRTIKQLINPKAEDIRGIVGSLLRITGHEPNQTEERLARRFFRLQR